MNWLQIRLFGPYISSFSTNSYGYYSQKSQNLFSNSQIFASAQIVRQAARGKLLWRRSHNFGSRQRLKKAVGQILNDLQGLSHLIIEGCG